MAHGKKYREALKHLEGVTTVDLDQAVDLLKKTSSTKFDSSCEVHIRLGIDTTQADQLVRSTISLPHGTGRSMRVIAFVPDDKIKEAKEAGAVKAGLDDLIEEILKGWMEFDVAVATPDVMKSLGKVAKTLGTKGLMPNPKAGTVAPDIGKAIGEIKKGRVEYRADKLGQIHNVFGKVSFSEEQLKDNLRAFLRAVNDSKPSTIKGTFVQNVSVATTMGPGIRLDLQKVMAQLR
ncbi:MAG TPA: 50S ribosomal protein L1 [Candidatus Gracilibacteria bacterium]|nr:50S ribosomal protein L1 [Candidatus Gracilibacteria bacterium]